MGSVMADQILGVKEVVDFSALAIQFGPEVGSIVVLGIMPVIDHHRRQTKPSSFAPKVRESSVVDLSKVIDSKQSPCLGMADHF